MHDVVDPLPPAEQTAAPATTRQRVYAKGDGRCLIRAFLHGVGALMPDGVTDVLTGDNEATRRWIRDTRIKAAEKVKEKMARDTEFAAIVNALFEGGEQQYASFEQWYMAQQSWDVHLDQSQLWFGGSELLVHGLSELFGVTTMVTSVGHPGGETSTIVWRSLRVAHLASHREPPTRLHRSRLRRSMVTSSRHKNI